MQVIHLSQKELAERWRMSEATLERWRHVVVDDPHGLAKRTRRQARDHLGQVLRQQGLRGLARFLGHRNRGGVGHAAHRQARARSKQDRLVGLSTNGSGDLVGQVGGPRCC